MLDGDSRDDSAGQLWHELGTLLRGLREKDGLSLRLAEKATGWGRGNLSQIETGKARPSRAQVEWYDAQFGGDGMLVSLYAEARGAHGPPPRESPTAGFVPGDRVEIVTTTPLGEVVRPAASVPVGWRLHNAGTVPWVGRELRRVGLAAARGLIAGPDRVPLDDCAPGAECAVTFEVRMPEPTATLVACWEIVDANRRPCFPGRSLLRVMLVSHEAA